MPRWHSIFMYNLNCRFASSHGRFAGFAGDDEDDGDGGTHYSVPKGNAFSGALMERCDG